MLGSMRGILSPVVLGTGLFLSGCQSSTGRPATTAASAGEAVHCSKCNVTWVKSPVQNQKGRVISYTTKKSMECPDCKTAVQNFFASGQLKHTCATCGPDAMEICKAH